MRFGAACSGQRRSTQSSRFLLALSTVGQTSINPAGWAGYDASSVRRAAAYHLVEAGILFLRACAVMSGAEHGCRVSARRRRGSAQGPARVGSASRQDCMSARSRAPDLLRRHGLDAARARPLPPRAPRRRARRRAARLHPCRRGLRAGAWPKHARARMRMRMVAHTRAQREPQAAGRPTPARASHGVLPVQVAHGH